MATSELEGVIASIEEKLSLLEKEREEIEDKIELKQAQIGEIRSTLEHLRNLQAKLPSASS